MKKVCLFLLTAVLLLGVAGCIAPQTVTEAPPAAAPTTAAVESGPTPTESAKIEKITLVMKGVSRSDENNARYIDMMEKGMRESGLQVELNYLDMPEASYVEKLTLAILGGTVIDIMYFQGGDLNIANQGLLEDLTPYIERSPIIRDGMAAFSRERMKNYPYLLWIKPVASRVPVVRSDWFKDLKTGAALIADPTVDNYYALLKELKDTKSKYGMTVAGSLFELDSIFNQAFGVQSTWLKDNSGKYVFAKVTEFERNKVAFYTKLYQEGLLDPEFLTKKWDTKEQAFYTGEVGLIAGTSGKVIDIYDSNMKKQNGDAATLVALPPAKGIGFGFQAINVTKEDRGIAISSQSTKKDTAWKVLEFFASDKGQFLDRLGYEGTHYEIKGNKIHLLPEAQNWYALYFERPNWKPSIELATPILGKPASDSLSIAENYFVKDVSFVIPETLVTEIDTVTSLYNEWAADVITGKKSIDTFDAFVASWYSMGGTKITEYANANLK